MLQRVVIISGQTSKLLYGDPEYNDDQYKTFLPTGGEPVDCALPVLLQNKWEIVSVTPISDSGGSALVALRIKESNENDKESMFNLPKF